MKLTMKPHITRDWFGTWRCVGYLFMGLGGTPKEAYENWFEQATNTWWR